MKKVVLLAFVSACLLSTLVFIRFVVPVKAEPKTIYVDASNIDDPLEDGSLEHPFDKIQEGVDAAASGDTVFVYSGTYYEWYIILDKDNLSLVGESKDNTVIDGEYGGWILIITAQNVTVTGFTIQESSKGTAGVFLSHATKSKISNNIIKTHDSGIYSVFSNGNVIENNWVLDTYAGIILSTFCGENRISSNDVVGNTRGIALTRHAHHNEIENNKIVQNTYGVSISLDNNSIFGNQIINNNVGIYEDLEIGPAQGYRIFHNNFINNTKQASVTAGYTNTWDDGYPSGGNYWSDYNGTDANQDGIGDTSYEIDADNQDRYPLMGPISFFNAGTWDKITYYIHTVSNSTVSDFYFNGDDELVSFNVTGLDDTTGFCRVAIPKELLWCDTPDQWQVWVNNTLIEDRKIMEDINYTYIYFTYNQSTQNVEVIGVHVIPEFPTWTSMLLILIMLTVAIAIQKRRLLK